MKKNKMHHPEAVTENVIEPTVGEQLRLAEFNKKIEKLDRLELLEITQMLAKQALVTHPSVIRYLAHEAARNLSGGGLKDWSQEAKQIRQTLTDRSFD